MTKYVHLSSDSTQRTKMHATDECAPARKQDWRYAAPDSLDQDVIHLHYDRLKSATTVSSRMRTSKVIDWFST